jgi:hypothetical protein
MQHSKDSKNHQVYITTTLEKLKCIVQNGNFLTYIDLQEADHNLETVKKYAQLSMEFCNRHEHTYWINLVDCTKITRYIDRQIKEVEDLNSLVRQLTRIEDEEKVRFKRGVFNFIGGISKILFGTMDSEDASYYAEKFQV